MLEFLARGSFEERAVMQDLERRISFLRDNLIGTVQERLKLPMDFDRMDASLRKFCRSYCTAVVGLAAAAIRSGLSGASVLYVIGYHQACCLYEPSFREKTPLDVHNVLYPALMRSADESDAGSSKRLLRDYFSASGSDGIPMVPDVAGIVMAALLNLAVIGSRTEDMKPESPRAVEEVDENYEKSVTAFYAYAAKQYIPAVTVNRAMRMVCGFRIEDNPYAVLSYQEPAYGFVVRAAKQEPNGYERWNGVYFDMDGNAYTDRFHPRYARQVALLRHLCSMELARLIEVAGNPGSVMDLLMSEKSLDIQMRYYQMIMLDTGYSMEECLSHLDEITIADECEWMADMGDQDPYDAPGSELDLDTFLAQGPGDEEREIVPRGEVEWALGCWLSDHKMYSPAAWQRSANRLYRQYNDGDKMDVNLEQGICTCIRERDAWSHRWQKLSSEQYSRSLLEMYLKKKEQQTEELRKRREARSEVSPTKAQRKLPNIGEAYGVGSVS